VRKISRYTQIEEHTMPTQIEYALMSANVYGNYPDVNGSNPVRSGNNNLPVPNGWSQITTPDYKQNTPDSGFMASVYTTGSEVVIAYAGTTDENPNDWLTGNLPAGTGLSNFNNITGPVVATQVVQAAKLYLKVLKDPQFAGKTISFTGHSLGGGLASLMAVYFDKPAIVFDEAFFSKSADSAAVVNSLRTALLAENLATAGAAGPLPLPQSFIDYQTDTSLSSLLTNSWAPSVTRLARQFQVTNISIKGEVLSVLSDPTLGSIGFIVAAATGFLPVVGLPLAALALLAGRDIGKINNGTTTPIDLNAVSNLGWGAGLESAGVAGDPVALHSISLLTGLLLSPSFKDTLTQHHELLARLFSSPFYKNDPKNANIDNLIEVLIKGQYENKNTLNILSEDVNKINLQAGLTAQDFSTRLNGPHGTESRVVNVAAALVDAEFAGLYVQRGQAGLTLHVLKLQGNAVVVDSTDLGAELKSGINGLRSLLKYLSNPTNSLTEHNLTAPNDARWAIQSGAAAMNYTAGADGKADVILGWNGDDTMNGGGGNDLLVGGAGKDTMDGGEGNDTLYGGAGDDILIGGAGNDNLQGGADNDTYQFDAAWGKDVITDSDGKGTITIGGQTLGTAKGAGKTNVWVTELGAGSGQFVGMAVYDDASSSTGKKLIITKGTDTSNTIIINNFDLAAAKGAGYLGIKLDKTQHIALTQGNGTAQGASTPNVYADRYFNPSSLDGKNTQFKEGNGASFSVSLAVGAKAGDTVRLSVNGGLSGKLKTRVNGSLVDAGGASLVLKEGQTLASFELVNEGEIEADLTGSISASYSGEESADSNSWDVTVKDAGEVTRTYLGDQRPKLIGTETQTDVTSDKDSYGTYAWSETTWASDGTLTNGIAEAGFADVIYGSSGIDKMNGLDGKDVLDGRGGNDQIDGGDGNDMITGGAGSDTIKGGAGDDVIHSAGDSFAPGRLYPGEVWMDAKWVKYHGQVIPEGSIPTVSPSGINWGTYKPLAGESLTWGIGLNVSNDDDVVDGGGRDRLIGGEGDDSVVGAGGDDVLEGGDGNDRMDGDGIVLPTSDEGHFYYEYAAVSTHGVDYMDGGAGDDFMKGGGGADQLFGGDGKDTLYGTWI
jgi:Ca2+-binding RTX toxin-like protein